MIVDGKIYILDGHARVSAAMESLELWHAESLHHLPRETVTLRSMGRGNPIPQASFPWRPDTRRLDDAPMPWVEAQCLIDGPGGWLPCSMLEIDFTLHRGFEPRMRWFDPNPGSHFWRE